MGFTRLVLILCSLAAATGASAQPAAAPPPQRAIVNVTGQLYRAQNNNHYTVFLVTPDGVIMSDPINRDFARWLKAEIATRFKVPVRYVLYTHRDWDHASGGVVFADTAEFVGHVNMLAALAPPAGNPPLPADAVKIDANRNGLVERSEAAGPYSDRFALFDHNRDGVLSGAEIARGSVSDVHPPTVTYTDRHTVTLGGKRVTMTYLGTAHADDSSVLHFPDERAVFSADILQVRRLPGGLAPAVGAWIDALTTITALDFEHALTGHALSGTRKDAMQSLQYLLDISRGVAAGIAAGRSLPEIQKTLTLDAYKEFERWDTIREAHIAAVYATIAGSRPVGVAVTAQAAPVSGQPWSADEAAVRKLMDSMVTAWARGDVKALAAVYTVDAEYASSTGFTASSRAEIEQAYVGQFGGVYKGTTLTLTITSVRFFTADVAMVNADFEVTGMRGPGGQPAPPRRGSNTSILVRTKGEWLMTAHRGWVPTPPAAP